MRGSEKIRFYTLPVPFGYIRQSAQFRCGQIFFSGHQIFQFIIQDFIVDLLPHSALIFGEVGKVEFFQDFFHNPAFDLKVVAQVRLDRTYDIRDVRFAGVVKETGKLKFSGPASGFGLCGAVERVLCYGIKIFQVSPTPAHQAQGMGNVLDADVFCSVPSPSV